ncbi:MAG: peptidoglycan DD-metalloendopeptidase family protein [Halarcobacter sp.]
MKNRLIITVSDVHGTKAYNVHQIVKKLSVIIIISVLLILGIAFLFINSLSTEIQTVKIEKKEAITQKENEIKVLTEKEKKLQAQNQFYSMQIKGKVEDIEALSSKLDEIEEMIGIKAQKEKELSAETLNSISVRNKRLMFISIPNGAPLKETRVTSNYGYRIHPVTKKRKFHRGIDLKAGWNTKVYATADGIVTYVQPRNIGDFGRVIKIQHNFGFETIYAHLNKTEVKAGDIIKKNQEIGLSGSSGRSTAPHLHYEVKYGGRILNPINFMKWQMDNFNDIFKKERRVKWESLVNLIRDQSRMVLQ